MPCYLQLHVTTWWAWIAYLVVLSIGIGAGQAVGRRWGLRGQLIVAGVLLAGLVIAGSLSGRSHAC